MNAKPFRKSRLLISCAFLVAAGLFLFPPVARADIFGLPFSLGGAANYVVLGLGGTSSFQAEFEVYQSGTNVYGNVGVGAYTQVTHAVDAHIHGRWDYDPTVTGTNLFLNHPYIDNIDGGAFQMSMAGIVADARNASNQYAGLAPTQTFTTLNSGQVIVGNGGLNVIRVTGDVSLSGGSSSLTLQGGPNDSFVFQLTAQDASSVHTLNLSGVTMHITGVSASQILWNMNGLGGGITITSGATVYGTFLAPDRSILGDHANLDGRLIGGGGPDAHSNSMSVHSTSMIVPEPASLVLTGFGLALCAGAGYLRRRR